VSSFNITPDQLPAILRGHARRLPRAVHDGLVMAAQRGRALLVSKSPVDTGVYKNAWRVRHHVGGGAELYNDAPHAGIIEAGARPHGVNAAGIAAITAWAMRKLGLGEKEARGVAFAVAAKLKKTGQKGLWIVRDNIPELLKYAQQEVARSVKRALDQRGI